MALKEEIERAEKQYGKGVIMKLGDQPVSDVSAISTGVPALDHALGVYGLPRGRITEIFGPPSGGKSTIAQQVIACAQKLGGLAAYIDMEHSIDANYAKALGVDIDNLYICQPDYGEQSLELAQAFVRSGEADVVVIDSVASLVPKAELQGDVGDSYMGLQARLMSQGLRMLVPDIHKSNAVVIFINQTRQKIGVVYGNPETTPGGTALPFYAGVRISVRPGTPIKEGDVAIGCKTKIKVVKNKVAPPLREIEVDMIYGRGIEREGGLIDLAIDYNLIEKSGSWLTMPDGERFQGRDNASTYLREHVEVADKLEASIRASAKVK